MRAEARTDDLDPGLVVMAPIPLNARVARWGADRARVVHSGMGARSRLRLTHDGRQFIVAYRRFRDPLGKVVDARFKRIFGE